MYLKKVAYMFKNIVFGLALISIIACGSKPRVSLDEEALQLKPSAQHEVIAAEVANLLENYSRAPIPSKVLDMLSLNACANDGL